MGWIEVQTEILARNLVEKRVPELGRIGEVAGKPEPLPAVHRAIFDHDPDPPILRVPDDLAKDPAYFLYVLGGRTIRPAADKRADEIHIEQSGRVDDPFEMLVMGTSPARIGVEVVVV